ncbi:MAG TPA: hypothetical protein ENN87_03740 [Phycisphaerales bacterium]|nr:hypothetical protein [Phycisphaerales bacterium]
MDGMDHLLNLQIARDRVLRCLRQPTRTDRILIQRQEQRVAFHCGVQLLTAVCRRHDKFVPRPQRTIRDAKGFLFENLAKIIVALFKTKLPISNVFPVDEKNP